MARNETKYNKVIGYNKESNEIYICNYTFDDFLHDKPFRGATGSVLSPLTSDQVEYYNDIETVLERFDGSGLLKDEYDEDIREECIDEFASFDYDEDDFDSEEAYEDAREKYIDENASDKAEEFNRELAEKEINYAYGSFPFHDDSDIGYITEEDTKILEEAFGIEIETFECIGGGRCFNDHTFNKDFVSLDDDIVASIKLIEGIA